jgi:hypothetical protein
MTEPCPTCAAANEHRRAAERARERAALAEQAVHWMRLRVDYLERQLERAARRGILR